MTFQLLPENWFLSPVSSLSTDCCCELDWIDISVQKRFQVIPIVTWRFGTLCWWLYHLQSKWFQYKNRQVGKKNSCQLLCIVLNILYVMLVCVEVAGWALGLLRALGSAVQAWIKTWRGPTVPPSWPQLPVPALGHGLEEAFPGWYLVAWFSVLALVIAS